MPLRSRSVRPPSDRPRANAAAGPLAGPGLWRVLVAVGGGLAAGAGAAHLLHTRGRPAGLAPPAAAPGSGVRTPEDYDADEPRRGRLAGRPEHIPHRGWTDILWRVGASYFGDRVGFIAGGVTFFIVLSLFPMLAAFVTLYGLFADPADAWARLQFLYSVLPPNVAEFLGEQMQRLAANSSTQLTFTLIWTFALSLWTANGGIKNLFYGLNLAYHEVEKRNIVRYNLICLAFTLSGLAAVLVSAGLVVGVPLVLALFGLEDDWARLAPLRWPLLFIGYVAALTMIYRGRAVPGPRPLALADARALFAAVLSLSVSAVFSWYLGNFVRTDSYGPLAAVMGFFLWTWISVQIILMGAELNAETERQTAVDTTTGAPLPLGERGALVADTVGARRGSPAALTFTLRHAEAVADRITRRRARRGDGGGL